MSLSDDEADIEGSRAPLMEHLVELRHRLIVCAVALAVGFVVCFVFSKQLYEVLLRPYILANALLAEQKHSGHGPFDLVLTVTGFHHVKAAAEVLRLQSTAPLESFFTYMKLSMFGAVGLTFPILAWQLYRFVAPGLYRRERKAFLPFLLAAPVLFALGASLVYFIMLPFVLWFALSQQIVTAQVRVDLVPKVSEYLSLVMQLLLAFGLCFQLPVVLSLLGMAGILSADTLKSGRRYAIVGVCALAAVVTPPDPISMISLAVPLVLLYEISIWCVKLIELRRAKEDAAAG